MFYIRTSITLVFILIGLKLAGQAPLNDICSFSRLISIPDDGDTCISGTTINATSDGIFNSCDSATVNPIPNGGNEVWFTFIAAGTNNVITVTPGGVIPAQFVSITIPTGNCTSTAFITCNTSATVTGTASVNGTFAAGTQIWFSVTALAFDGDFTVCISSSTPTPIPSPGVGTDCSNAIPICDKHTFISPGPVFNNATGPISCYAFGPQNVLWYKFTAGTNDSLIWLATPNAGYELDWSLNDITSGCPGIPVACNFATTGGGGAPTGMVSGSVNPCGPISQICTPIVLTAGNTYALHFNIENFLNAGIDTPAIKIEFGGNFKMAPYADFSLSANSGCDSLTITFTNNSVVATTYQWDFGNGNTSLLANPPAQSYTTPGTYVVSLIASNPLSCASVKSMEITVFPKPLATFSIADSIICLGDNDTLNSIQPANANYSYNWSFNGATVVSGTSSGPYILNWNTPGIKTVDLIAQDNSTGCMSVLFSKTIQVNALPDSSFSLTATACEGETIAITYNGFPNVGNTYTWNFDSANVITGTGVGPYNVSYPVAGTYIVSLLVDLNGCKSDDTNTVIVSASPVSNAGPDFDLCSGIKQQIGSPSISGLTYSWSPATGLSASNAADPDFILINNTTLADTLFFVLTTSVGNCSDEDSVRIIVQKNNTSSFSLSDDSLCANQTATVSYTGNGTAAANYNWSFGSGTSTPTGSQNYNINWSSGLTDTVSLFVSENGCTSDTTSMTVTVFDVPIAFAGADIKLCSGETDTLGTFAVPGTNYQWSPSTGLSNSVASNPVLTGITTNIQNDTLYFTLTSSIGICFAKDTVRVIIQPVQDISLTGPVSACINNNSIAFSNTSPQVSGYTFAWDFGSNSTPSTSNLFTPPPVSFTSIGSSWIIFTATGGSCPSVIDSIYTTIFPVPDPGFTVANASGCPPLTVSFIDTTQTLAGSAFYWDFGNGNTSTLQNPQMVYNQSGVYDVTLTVTTPDTCSASFTQSGAVQVFDLPQPDFIPVPPVASILNPQIEFTSQSINTLSCLYNFGDGFNSFLCDDIHIYKDTGSYNVQLIATSSQGCIDTVEHIVRIEPFESFFVPSAFTPNGDLHNDLLTYGGSEVNDFKITIFNRWGNTVFFSDNISIGWDGLDIKSGGSCPEGLYVYKIIFEDFSGNQKTRNGIVSLIR